MLFVLVFIVTAYLDQWFSARTRFGTVNDLLRVGFWRSILFYPTLAFSGAIGCLLLEAWFLGWKRSALRRLILMETASSRTDLFYFWFNLSGLKNVFVLVLGLGAGNAFYSWTHNHFNLGLLSHVSSTALCFLLVCLINTFTFYIAHRFFHEYLWEVHKVHHTAEELNIITPHRNHPFEHVFTMLINAMPSAILGAPTDVLMIYITGNAVYQQLVHSSLDWKLPGIWGNILEYVFITPQAHRIHHSSHAGHYEKNFGSLALWDILFGTFQHPAHVQVTRIGLPMEKRLNRDKHFNDMWLTYAQQIRILFQRAKRTFKPAPEQAATRKRRDAA